MIEETFPGQASNAQPGTQPDHQGFADFVADHPDAPPELLAHAQHWVDKGVMPQAESDALEAAEHPTVRHDWHEIASMDRTSEHEDRHVGFAEGHDPNDVAPTKAERTALVVTAELGLEAIEADSTPDIRDLSKKWEYDENGELRETMTGRVRHGNEASHVLSEPGTLDPELSHVVASEINDRYDQAVRDNVGHQVQFDKIDAVPVTEQNAERLDAIKRQIRSQMDVSATYEGASALNVGLDVVATELAEREKIDFERLLDARIEADKLPWTMAHIELQADRLEGIKLWHEDIVGRSIEPLPGDEFKVRHL